MKTGRLIVLAGVMALTAGSVAGYGEDEKAMKDAVRKPTVAGQFYTGDPGALRREIEDFLEAVENPELEGEVVAIVSPHAGYMYSGQVAAHGYETVRGKSYDAVVVISPCHVDHFDFNSVFPGRAYKTPLGEIAVDSELAGLIGSKDERVRIDGRGHIVQGPFGRGEHSLEVQLPFLQVALGEFKLVPIVMGDQGRSNVEALGRVLGDVLEGRNVLIVASTDLSHFHPGSAARKLDGVFMEELKSFDHDRVLTALSQNRTEACGGGPTAAAMIAAEKLGAGRCEVLNYAHSGDVTGDDRSVVGYVSAVMLREKKEAGKREKESSKPNPGKSGGPQGDAGKEAESAGGGELSGEDKLFLLTLVRKIIDAECRGGKPAAEPSGSPIMDEPRGAFVTLKKKGRLRGCIGYIEAIKPLFTTIREMAHAAAFNDWRFPPVTAAEVPELEIEISVLSPVREITDTSEIEVGRHGIIITRGANRGLLLPQVATEWGWDRDTFLRETCRKAGLPMDAWEKKGTKIEIFSAEIFSEKELGLR